MTELLPLAERIQHRKDAEEMFAFIGERPLRFWEVLRDLCNSQLPQELVEAEDGSMNEVEAIKYEKTSMTFGKYAGQSIGEIPTEYLAWIVDGDKKMRRYVKSRVFKQRLSEE